MGKFQDLTGKKFGRLTVLERAENTKDGQVQWLCRCACGKKVVVRGGNLKNGHSRSCGCWNLELTSQRTRTHGLTESNIYKRWSWMKGRCFDANNPNYPNYGGRGIKMCERWKNDFTAFLEDVSKLPHFGEEGYSLDRINNDGDYEPGNVRFATDKEQCCNRRSNIIVEFEGEKMCLKDAAARSGINYGTLWGRYKRGDRGERLFRPVER